jgi:hypothetical protein
MSERSNFIIKEKDKIKIYYRGNTSAHHICNMVALGLKRLKRFIRKAYRRDKYLMDNAFCEGALMIDVDNKKILYFDSLDGSSFGIRRHKLNYLRQIWKDWEVDFAYRGIIDIAVYLNMVEDYMFFSEPFRDKPDLQFFEGFEYGFNQYFVLTTIKNGEITDYSIDGAFNTQDTVLLLGEKYELYLKPIHIMEYGKRKGWAWQKETETEYTLLLDYDQNKMLVSKFDNPDDRYLDFVRNSGKWQNWQIEWQTEGLIFHFHYTNRDASIIEYTAEDFEKKKENYFSAESLRELLPIKSINDKI